MNKDTKQARETDAVSRPLIVSYSYSGNTHQIAQGIQLATGGDWCEIHPWQLYPMAFPELLEQVKRELQSGCRPRLLPGARSPKAYRIIFVGSPNWCGTIAPPMTSWLYQNDLSGKIILPFYAHCGGVPCDFRRDIVRICPKADVREALGVLDSGEEDLQETLRQWFIQTGVWDAKSPRSRLHGGKTNLCRIGKPASE